MDSCLEWKQKTAKKFSREENKKRDVAYHYNLMLPKDYRITVLQFWKNPNLYQKTKTKHVSLFAKKNSINHPRVAIYVPKHLDKRSSQRHKTRRIIVETLRKAIFRKKEGYDFFIRAERLINGNEVEQFRKELLRSWGRATQKNIKK